MRGRVCRRKVRSARKGAWRWSVTEIRVVLGEMPQMLSDILRNTLREETGVKIVGEAESGEGVREAVETHRADVVITGLGAEANRALCRVLLVAHPHVSVIGIPADRSGAKQWQLRLYEASLGDVSPDELVEAIRLANETRLKEAP